MGTRELWLTAPVMVLSLVLVGCVSGAAPGPDGRPDNAPGATSVPPSPRVLSSVPERIGGPLADQAEGVIRHGSRERPWVALTFDAEMTPSMRRQLHDGTVPDWYDERVIAELRRTQTPATIFASGLWAIEYPDEVRDMAADPLFDIENHSMSHAAFDGPCPGLDVLISEQDKVREVADAAHVLDQLTGRTPQYFRFPGGCHTPADVALVREVGQLPVNSDVVVGELPERGPDTIARTVLDNVRPGSIIVLPLHGDSTTSGVAESVGEIIHGLRIRDLHTVTLEELLASS